MIRVHASLIILVVAFFMTACSANGSSSFFKGRVGESAFTTISHPIRVVQMKAGEEKEWEPAQIKTLQGFLLNDRGYHFDRTKKCVFIPQTTLGFEGKERTIVIISFVCKQIKVISEDRTVILDTDPMAAQLESFMDNIR